MADVDRRHEVVADRVPDLVVRCGDDRDIGRMLTWTADRYPGAIKRPKRYVAVDRIPELVGEIERLRARTERFQRQPPRDQANEQSGQNYLDQGVSRGRVDFSPLLP